MPNKILIIGYADRAGLTAPKLIAGPGITTDEQTEAINAAARDRHEFPKGIQCVDFYELDQPAERHVFIDAEAAKTIQGNFQQRLKLQEAAAERAAAARTAQTHFTAANNVFQAAARVRNEALGAVAAKRNLLAADGLPAADRNAVQKAVDELQPKADAAVAAFAAVLKQFDIVRNPKASPAEVTSALIALGVIEAPKAAK